MGGIVALIFTPFTAQAQTCANSTQSPLTKPDLDQIAISKGIDLTKVGLAFEAFALKTIRPGLPIPQNREPFPSQERADKVGIPNVVPDGVLPLVVARIGGGGIYADSVFYEAKAVKSTLLPPSYSQYQILGFLDALNKSDARAAGEIPAIIFMTTSDISRISNRTRVAASFRRVGVWHTIACRVIVPPVGTNNLQLGKAENSNPEVYFLGLTIPRAIGPGSRGTINP